MTEATQPPLAVDLAHEPDLRLGGLEISPSGCRLRGPNGEQHIEPRVMEVLVVLARHPGQTVTRDQLIDACWGGRIVSDDAVSRAVAQVRSLARGTAPAPFVLETVPKVGFRLVPGEAVDDPPATPVAPTTARRPTLLGPGRWVVGAVALAVLLVMVGAAWWTWTRFGAGDPLPPARIDVMAFTARSPDPESQRIAGQIADSIVHVLASAGVAASPHALPRDAGGGDAELRVAGEVQRVDDGYEVHSQVLDRKTGIVLLSAHYRRSAAEVAQSASELGEVIGATLQCVLDDRKAARAPLSTEALSLYLNACDAVFGEGDSAQRMLAVTRRLVKVAPQFAGAHAMHSIAAALSANEVQANLAQSAALHAEAKAAAERALRLDPHTPKAYSGLALNEGALSQRLDQDWVAEEGYLQKGLAIDPDLPPARNEYSNLLRSVGRWREATELIRGSNAAEDPRDSPGGDPRVALMLAAQGDLAAAEAELVKLERSRGASQASMHWAILFWWSDPKAALAKLPTFSKEQLGETDPACFRKYLQGLIDRAGKPGHGLPTECATVDPHWRVRMLAREGDLDGAFDLLKPPGRVTPISLYYPEMRPLRADPRFWEVAARVRLVEYWLKSGHWPDFCGEPNLGYDCKTRAIAAVSGLARGAAR